MPRLETKSIPASPQPSGEKAINEQTQTLSQPLDSVVKPEVEEHPSSSPKVREINEARQERQAATPYSYPTFNQGSTTGVNSQASLNEEDDDEDGDADIHYEIDDNEEDYDNDLEQLDEEDDEYEDDEDEQVENFMRG